MTIPTFIGESWATSAYSLAVNIPPEEAILAGDTIAVGVSSKRPFEAPPGVSDDAGNTYVSVPREPGAERPKDYAFYVNVVTPMKCVTATFIGGQQAPDHLLNRSGVMLVTVDISSKCKAYLVHLVEIEGFGESVPHVIEGFIWAGINRLIEANRLSQAGYADDGGVAHD